MNKNNGYTLQKRKRMVLFTFERLHDVLQRVTTILTTEIAVYTRVTRLHGYKRI